MYPPQLPKSSGKALDNGTPVLVFVSGFPDSYNSFDAIASNFKDTHHIRTPVMPDYERTDGLRQFWGYSFVQIVDDLAKSLKEVQDAAPLSTVTLVGHDWGSYVCQRFVSKYHNAKLISRVVYLDVGVMTMDDIVKESTMKQLAIIGAYQLWLVTCFVVGRLTLTIVGDLLMAMFPWKLMGPTPHEYKLPRHWREVHCWMGYPYFRLHIGKLFDSADRREGAALAFVPTVPTLYAYGKKKRIMFHTPGFIKKLDAQQNGGGAHELECGHWVQTQKPVEVSNLIKAFDKGESCKALTSERVD